MTSIDESLVDILEAASAVTALASTRIYPLYARQTAVKPFIVYQRISSVREHSHSGPSSLARPRFQFRCAANTYGEARQLADAVRGALDGYKGTVASVEIGSITFENEIDVEEVADDSQSTVYSSILDFYVWHGD